MNILSKAEMKEIFTNLGFKDFVLRDYDDELKKIFEEENRIYGYLIDVVPSAFDCDFNHEASLLEKHFYKPVRFNKLLESWTAIVIKFMCFYRLTTIFVSGGGVRGYEDFPERTPNGEGYILEFDYEEIDDMYEFVKQVEKNLGADINFWFKEIGLRIYIIFDDVYLLVDIVDGSKLRAHEFNNVLELLKKLAVAEGLFFR